MAILDPRLLPLVETLAESGADWLAFEIIDGVRRGREPEEREELLRAARENVRSREMGRVHSHDIPKLAEFVLGDDQIAWAADYVLARLNGSLLDLDAGCAMLETIVAGSVDPPDEADISHTQADGIMPVSVVLEGKDGLTIERGSIAAARKAIPALRDALVEWSLQARSTSQ